ncbi:unnamed protein product [Symbiodinium pilosum]|uniref:Pentacotripeptide-repeat region of PRORP domain-containing protein n=1 Tax=Symbiodinium pilosum TaxID=2952 RepID=A0A812M7A4_SYMPI|nr:unnamed protein product [Symbiodinium pilosum]
MRKSTFRPQLLNYNELISAAANMHDVNSAVAWFDHLEKENLQPNVISFNAVLSAAAKKGALDISVALYHRMEAASVQPDSYTFNTLISAGARAGSGISAAGEWLQIMKSACIKPNEATYNALMDVAAKHQESLAAERWFGELVAEGWRPSAVSWKTLVAASVNCGDLPSAEKSLKAMAANNFQPDAALCFKEL